jgi:hypothetical protein
MIRKFIEMHYSAMMYKQKREPLDWLGRMAFIFNFHLFFILSSIIFNIIFFLEYRFESNKILYYTIVIALVYFAFYLNNKNMEKFILRFKPQKTYKKTKPFINLINIFFVIILGLTMFYLFILSFKIQNYI